MPAEITVQEPSDNLSRDMNPVAYRDIMKSHLDIIIVKGALELLQ